MGMASNIVGGSNTGNTANVDATYNLNVTLPAVATQSGYNRPMSEVDVGLITGTPTLLAGEVSQDFASRISHMNYLGGEVFSVAAQNTGLSSAIATTMTLGYGGALTTNASGITTINTGVLYVSKQVFPIYAGSETYHYLKVKWTGTMGATNTNIDCGIGLTNVTTPFAPLDGVFLRTNSAGVAGVSNVNGIEQTTAAWTTDGASAFSPTIGTAYDIIICTSSRQIVFWLDLQDGNSFQIVGTINLAVGTRRPMYSSSGAFFLRHAIGGTAASVVQSFSVLEYQFFVDGPVNFRTPEGAAALASGGQQGQAAHTMGSLALYTNSLAPGAGAAMTNTTAALGSGLGGQFAALPTLAANTDGIVCSYQNPVASVVVPGRNMLISGVTIDAVVTTATTGTADFVFVMALNYGHTAVSLATAEAVGAKAPRRIPLGILKFATTAGAAPIGTQPNRSITVDFGDSPVPVFPGEFAAISAKNVGAVSTAGVITFVVTPIVRWVL